MNLATKTGSGNILQMKSSGNIIHRTVFSFLLLFIQVFTTVFAGEVFTRPRPVTIQGYDKDVMEPFITRDGKYLFFNSNKTLFKSKDIYWAKRINDHTFRFMGEVQGINTGAVEGVPSMDRYGNFYFVSTSNYKPFNLVTVYRGKFHNGHVSNVTPIPEISLNKAGWLNMDVEISEDGNTLYSTQTYFGSGPPPKKSYFFQARKQGGHFVVDMDSAHIYRYINQDEIVYAAAVSTDELEFFYTRLKITDGKPPVFETLRASRATRQAAFSKPEVITAINGFAEAPALSADEKLLYFHKKPGAFKPFALYSLQRNQ